MTELNPLYLVEKLICFGVILQTVEFLSIKTVVSNRGIWRWEILRDDFNSFPKALRFVFDLFLSYPNFIALLCLQLTAASLLLLDFIPSAAVILLLVTAFLVCLRWRGTFNGGSDYMTIIVLSTLSVAALFDANVNVVLGCLWYLALQLIASYFSAGIVKLVNPRWRSGIALAAFLDSACYRQPEFVSMLFRNSFVRRTVAWGVIVFECSFLLVLLFPNLVIAYLCAALSFHIGNYFFFGLNRFIFAWIPTYPALYFCCVTLPGTN